MKMSLYKEGKHKTVITFDCRSVDKQMLHNYWAKEKRREIRNTIENGVMYYYYL